MEEGGKREYTALLVGNNREINTTRVKTLLTMVKDVETGKMLRNHVWVHLTNDLEIIKPSGDSKPIAITFTADTYNYMRGGDEESIGLKKLKGIKLQRKPIITPDEVWTYIQGIKEAKANMTSKYTPKLNYVRKRLDFNLNKVRANSIEDIERLYSKIYNLK